MNKYEKLYALDFDSKYEDYTDNNQKEENYYTKNQLNMLSTHEQMSKLNLNKTQMDFDATSLFPSAIWDNDNVFPKTNLIIQLNLK